MLSGRNNYLKLAHSMATLTAIISFKPATLRPQISRQSCTEENFLKTIYDFRTRLHILESLIFLEHAAPVNV